MREKLASSDAFSITEWLLTPFFYATSKILLLILGMPFYPKRTINRKMHDSMMQLVSSSASFPEYNSGVMSKDIRVPSSDTGVTNLARLFLPRSAAGPIMVFIHGGGWSTLGFSVRFYHDLCQYFCEKMQITVLSINYRLAPEYPFPTPLNDCQACLNWLASPESFADVPECIDRNSIIVAGDSAGGNLTSALALMYVKEKPRNYKIILQIPIYPCFFKRPLTHSRTNPSFQYLMPLPQQMMDQFEMYYKPPNVTDNDFSKYDYVNSENSSYLSSSRFPETVGIVAGMDILRDEGISYFEKLKSLGKRVEYRVYQNARHAFLALPDVASKDAKNAKLFIVESIIRVVREHDFKIRLSSSL